MYYINYTSLTDYCLKMPVINFRFGFTILQKFCKMNKDVNQQQQIIKIDAQGKNYQQSIWINQKIIIMQQITQPVTNQVAKDINVSIVDQSLISREKAENSKQKQKHCPFKRIKTTSKSLFQEYKHTDDSFPLKIQSGKFAKHILGRRLLQIYSEGTPLFPQNAEKVFEQFKQTLSMAKPTYLSEIKLLPLWHYRQLIQQSQINAKGYYEVVVWKDGRLTKQMIDDYIDFDTQAGQAIGYSLAPNQPWMQIILKVWAKINHGYDNLYDCEPFMFIKTFSYPDWEVVNPNHEQIELLINKLGKAQSGQQYFIALTKDDSTVGQFGFFPDCASFIITGYYQQYGDIYIKVKSYVYSKWNRLCCDSQSALPEQQPQLDNNQFIMPLKEFGNVFHLVFCTHNKYKKQQNIFYNKFNLNLDARQSKAKMLTFEVKEQAWVGINTYFPKCRSYHLSNPHRNFNNISQIPLIGRQSKALSDKQFDGDRQGSQTEKHRQTVIPFCKILIGKQIENANVEASFVESMKDKIMKNEDGDFLRFQSQIQYQYVQSDYFRGYNNEVTYLLKLSPGRYYIRYKIEQLKTEYRCIINTVSSDDIQITDAKKDKKQQDQFLTQVLSHKVRNQHRNITYMNPIKKGSWVSFNGDFNSVGYGYIVLQAVKNSESKIVLQIDPRKLKEQGYYIKGRTQFATYSVFVEDGQSVVIIIKKDHINYKGEWKWPPKNIVVKRIARKP